MASFWAVARTIPQREATALYFLKLAGFTTYLPRIRQPGPCAAAASNGCRRYSPPTCSLEFDIRGLFDNLAHDLLMAALRKHCQEPWILLYAQNRT